MLLSSLLIAFSLVTPSFQQRSPTAAAKGCGIVPTNNTVHPWSVGLYNSDGDYFCQGALISSRVVLTVASCLEEIPKVSAKIMATGELLESQKIVQHKTFSRSSDGKGSPNDDIALIFLKNSINPQSNASVICVPAEGQKFDDKDCLSSAVIDPKDPQFRAIAMPVVGRSECARLLKSSISNTQLCAGGSLNQELCSGDGGAPLICVMPSGFKRYVMVGVHSWGKGRCSNAQNPGVFTNLQPYAGWIEDTLKTSLN